MALNAKELIDQLTASFLPEKAAGLDAVVQVKLEGEGGGDWNIHINDGTFEVKEGAAVSPRLTLAMSMQDVQELIQGTIDPMAAFSRGKIKISGDLGIAMRLVGLFKR